MDKRTIASIIVGGLAVILILLTVQWYYNNYLVAKPANVQIIDHNLVHTSGSIFTLHYIESGRVVNSGGSASNPVMILLTVEDNGNNTLYTTTFTPEPSIVQPGQEAPFSKEFTSDDMGGYKGGFTTTISVERQ